MNELIKMVSFKKQNTGAAKRAIIVDSPAMGESQPHLGNYLHSSWEVICIPQNIATGCCTEENQIP